MLLLYKPLVFDEKRCICLFCISYNVFHLACGFVIGQSISVLTNQVMGLRSAVVVFYLSLRASCS